MAHLSRMKKIMVLLTLALLIAGCGTTGEVVKEVEDNSVLPTVNEKCYLKGKSLSCASIKTSSNGDIKILLTNDRYGITSLTKVSLIGLDSCSKRFSGEVEGGFDFRDVKEIVLNCNIDEPYIKTPIRIEYKRYEPTNSEGPQLTPYTVWDEEVDGEIVSIVY